MIKFKAEKLSISYPINGVSRVNVESTLNNINKREITTKLADELICILDYCRNDKSIQVVKFTSFQLNKPYVSKMIKSISEQYGKVNLKEENTFVKYGNKLAFFFVRLKNYFSIPSLPKRYMKKLITIELELD